MMRRILSRVHARWHRKRKEAELDAEIEFHLAEEAERQRDSGLSPDEARAAARADFGNVASVQESMRAVWGLSRDAAAGAAGQDVVRNALRNVLRSPRSSVAAVLCIALAMAATTAALTLVASTLLRPLPYPDADRLVRIWLQERDGEPRIALSYPELVELQEQLTSFDAFEATARSRIQFQSRESGQGSRRVEGEAVTAGYFDLLGVEPLLGRLFSDEEARGVGDRVILLSHASWANYHGYDETILGRELLTDEGVYQVVGVLPASFTGTVEDDSGDIEFWVPMHRYLDADARARRDLRIVWTLGRLAPGRSIGAARDEAAALSHELTRLFPDDYTGRTFTAEPLGENWRSTIRHGSLLLLAAALLVLIVASANVALLLLARSIENRRHWAMRIALGAGRRDVVRLVAAETGLLVAFGSALGLLAGPAALRAFTSQSAVTGELIPVFVRFTVDPVVALSTIAFFLLVALVAAMGPALHCLKLDANQVIQDGGRSAGGRAGRRWFRAMALTEVALSTVLAIGATLLVRSYSSLVNEELGFRTEGVLRIGLFVNESDVPDDTGLDGFHRRVRETVVAEPGVTEMGAVWPTVPIDWPIQAAFSATGLEPELSEESRRADFFVVDTGAFDTLGIRLVSGRGFTEADLRDAAPVGIVNRTLARRIVGGAGGGDPDRALGVEAEVDGRPFRIVGIVEDVRLGGPMQEPGSRRRVFLPLSQVSRRWVSLFIRTDGDPEALVAPLRRRLATLAPASALDWIGPMDQLVHDLFLRDMRFVLTVLGAFTLVGLFLSATGLFALLADSVARRRSELGLRQALGASPNRVLASVLGEAFGVVVVGMLLGTVMAWLFRQSLASMLHGLSPSDPWSHLGALLVITVVALVAAAVPALRAAGIDPAEALRGG